MKSSEIFKISDGEITVWIEQDSSIHIKAATYFGDPVELSAEEAKTLATVLLNLASKIDGSLQNC